ncbi:MAG: TolC family protein, partial [Pseudomonadales bacterium]
QLLFDGFGTRDEVARLGYERLAALYELRQASEVAALDASVAFLDTYRYQQLVVLAEENYVEHLRIYDKIEERAGGGVSQRVDLEQAESRVALAETNLLTEMTNLHDVRTRFQRIVGSLPANNLAMPTVPDELIPQAREAALNQAYADSPEINAAIESLLAAQQALNATNAPMMPRFDLRFREERENNTYLVDGRFDERAIELVMKYNLYRGGADSARKREYYQRYNFALEERKQACLNVRQNVVIAFNDIGSLREQLIYLDRSRKSQASARTAYNDQFDLGQRSLLDLLDTQNEYFDTQRAYVSAGAKLLAAQATTLSSMGLLLTAMGVDGLDKQADIDLTRGTDENSQPLCPEEIPAEITIDKEALLAKFSGNSRYRQVEENKVALELQVLFAFNSSVITENFDSEIANAAKFIRENKGVTAVVEGHSDITGPEDYNLWLSTKRAEVVRDMLINDHQISPEQIQAQGFGISKPIADNSTAEGRRQNRRVELVMETP